MNSGIASQYGFLFQRYAFIDIVISKISDDKIFKYEGKDDIDVSPEEEILSVVNGENNKQFIQVKSGIIQKDCWVKIIGNWLLADIDTHHKVIVEKELSFDPKTEESINYICEYFKEGKNKRLNSIARKVYDKYLADNQDFITLKKDIIKINQSIEIETLSMQKLITNIIEKIKKTYCPDIKIYEKAKEMRAQRLIEMIDMDINKKICEHKPFVLSYNDFIKYVIDVSKQISDNHYSIDISAKLKKQKELVAKNLIKNTGMREIKQLRLVTTNINFIIDALAKEGLYKEFREVYDDGNTEVINIEENALNNYNNTKFELGKNSTPKDLYFETIKKNIPSSILNNSPIYSNGCYVYLTGEDIESDKQISWGNENDNR